MPDMNQHTQQDIEKVSQPFYKNWIVWFAIGIIPTIIFAIFLGYRYGVQLPRAKQVQDQLKVEFRSITPLPNTNIVDTIYSCEPGEALVSADYLTNTGPTDIFNYYDRQLKQHGWQLKNTEILGDWDHESGMKIIRYCKGDYSAELDLAGQKAKYGWNYGFSVSWGLYDCKATSEGEG